MNPHSRIAAPRPHGSRRTVGPVTRLGNRHAARPLARSVATLVAAIAAACGILAGSVAPAHAGLFDFLTSPTVTVISNPGQLAPRESSQVIVRASAPARPGTVVNLVTAGFLNLGYSVVGTTKLDANLEARLPLPGRDFLGSYQYWAQVPATGAHQEGNSARFSVTIASPPKPVSPTCGGANPTRPDGTPWRCTYNDEFDGTSLDRKWWRPQTAFQTGTSSRYACAADRPDTISVGGGVLSLSLVELPTPVAACANNQTTRFVNGQVMHYQTFNQTYGKYEVRARVSSLRSPGAQTSFWLWPNNDTYGPWPASGEIDFAEMYSSAPDNVFPYMHYLLGENDPKTNRNVPGAVCPISFGDWNTYGMEWRPGQIKILVNDQVCVENNYSTVGGVQGQYGPFDKPFYLNLNQAMGTTGNEYDPNVVPDKVTTQIDYVRVWQ
ncbi:family 16 glycosylhydrolase [Nocardioides sp.]|uniref:glycoside hydrolase family 16 protein n=1 Tax=Nocardioides sp. TaxID=35761 RepID=UPI0035181C64